MADEDDGGLEDSTLTYIFLDVISCGLGGAILLGVILAVPREQKALPVSAAPYLVVRVEVEDTAVPRDDTLPLPNIWLKPPGADGFDLPLEQFDLATGRSRRGAELHPSLAGLDRGGSQVFVTGFYRHGEGRADLDPAGAPAGAPRAPLYELRVTEPPAGEWRFQVRYQNRRDVVAYFGRQPPAMKARVTAGVPSAPPAVNERMAPIAFGDLGAEVGVTVTAGKVKHVTR